MDLCYHVTCKLLVVGTGSERDPVDGCWLDRPPQLDYRCTRALGCDYAWGDRLHQRQPLPQSWVVPLPVQLPGNVAHACGRHNEAAGGDQWYQLQAQGSNATLASPGYINHLRVADV